MVRGSAARHQDELPVDRTLRRIVVLYRLLGWAWMLALVILTLDRDPDADATVVVGAMVLATLWTAATAWASRESGPLGRPWFVAADVAVALAVGTATTVAGAEELFHGGYPMSTLGVVAYGFGLRATIAASLLLVFEQVVVHLADERGLVPTAGSVTFLVFAIVFGWGFDAIRDQERGRLNALALLHEETAQRVRHEERAELANQLHDSVLQTLAALRRDADDPQQVRYLARRQEHQLRRTISEYRSQFDNSVRAVIEAACDEIEDTYRVEVDAVIRGDVECRPEHEALIAAAREALTNAAKHSGAETIDVYAELGDAQTHVFVKDRGRGFDTSDSGAGGLLHSLRQRVEGVGGSVEVDSEIGSGTEVTIRWAST